MSPSLQAFIAKWKGSAGSEEANAQSFLQDFCAAMGLPAVDAKGADSAYCFEMKIQLTHAEGRTSVGSADLFRQGCFVLEAKQGSTAANPGSAPLRGTAGYERYMERAFGQAVNYAQSLPVRSPFVLTCDIGHAFHVWEGFSGRYGGYGARRTILLDDLLKPDTQGYLRAIWLDPASLDPARKRALVTRDVATEIGKLAASLEGRFPPKAVAAFLMRCVFTFFAEDAGLLPERIFEGKLDAWRKSPGLFVKGMETLWERMNTGGVVWDEHAVLRFNGGLFAEDVAMALPLEPREIEMLFQAAKFNWAEVDPSIFGTLLESALSPSERHRLGAHYTPRAFIERLLKPALEEPLRADWELAQAEALCLLGENPADVEKAKARAVLHAFHRKLATTRVLDPACGSGNFLYVAYDLMKRIEREVIQRLIDLGETQRGLQLDTLTVTPAQFLGIEVKEWAAAIAELVLWIGHLQWFHHEHPGTMPPEPVLQRYENIQNRDAVLAWDGTKETGRSRWDGKTFKVHPVTGKDVPDEAAQTTIVEYVNPRPAAWPEADFIVGNPPFLGNARMREAMGDGYTEALRAAYPEVPDTVDFVLYWWNKAALAVRSGLTRRFGLITTNSLRQVKQRGVIVRHTIGKTPLKLLWAIPDHPWTDNGAAVRIAMTVGGLEGDPWLGRVIEEVGGDSPEAEAAAVKVEGHVVDHINEDLSAGANVTDAKPLKANDGLAWAGVQLYGAGFIVRSEQWKGWGRPPVVHPYVNGRDLMDRPRGVMVIDFYGLTAQEAQRLYPGPYQHVYEHVKPERDQNRREPIRNNWWLFGWVREGLRASTKGLPRFIVTVETAKHRVFQFLDAEVRPDNKLTAISSSDAFHLGILSSRLHEVWSLAAGSWMGVGNDPVYAKSRCFHPFPFPNAADPQKAVIRDLAERLDAHRKAAQERGVTITGMYNLLAKLRSGEAFTDQERAQHEVSQTQILRQLHDEMDAVVAKAYGWPAGLTDAEILTNLVALNKERVAEEATGIIRWLRPEYQAPKEPAAPVAASLGMEAGPAKAEAPMPETSPWPKETRDQLAAVRAAVLASPRLWSLPDVTACFRSRGRYRESIQAHLDLLADLGVLSRLNAPDGVRYHRPVQQASGG